MLAQMSSILTDTLNTMKDSAPELAAQALPHPQEVQAKA